MGTHVQNRLHVVAPATSNDGSRATTTRRAAAGDRGAPGSPPPELPVLKESDDRFTSPEFIDAVEESFGPIDFDPCWHEASAVKPRAFFDVRRGDDGLRDPWTGGLALVNPPWSAQAKWVERAHGEWLRGNVGKVVCLVPAKTDLAFFHRVLASDADLYLIEGRPRFFKEDGTSQPTMVAVMAIILGASLEERTRFSRLVRGSWCIVTKDPALRLAIARPTPLGAAMPGEALSCSAANDSSRVVLCTRAAGPRASWGGWPEADAQASVAR